MRSDYTFEVHKVVGESEFRHRERELGHRRALKGSLPSQGLASRMVGGLGRLRRATLRPPLILEGAMVLTDRICHLADGSLGHIAVRETEGSLVEVCVPG